MPEFRAKGKSKKVVNSAVSSNIHALAHGEHHGKRVRDQGKKGAHKQEVAIAERIARGDKGKDHGPHGADHRPGRDFRGKKRSSQRARKRA